MVVRLCVCLNACLFHCLTCLCMIVCVRLVMRGCGCVLFVCVVGVHVSLSLFCVLFVVCVALFVCLFVRLSDCFFDVGVYVYACVWLHFVRLLMCCLFV